MAEGEHEDVPTQAMNLADLGKPKPPPDPDQPLFRSRRRNEEHAAALEESLTGAEGAETVAAVGMPTPPDEGTEPEPPGESGLEEIFGAGAFQEYESESILPTGRIRYPADAGAVPPGDLPPGAVPPEAVPGGPPPPRPPMSRNQKILLAIAGGLVAVLALIALFLAGTRLAGVFPSGAVAESASPSPTPSLTLAPEIGPVSPGVHAWDELLGGECIAPYESPWQEEFRVVPCSVPHYAQLVVRGTFDDVTYPGFDELNARMNALCTDPAVIDYNQTSGIPDLQFAASFAVDEAEWRDGHRDYFCFVNRSSGEPVTGTVAHPQVAPTPAPGG